MIPAYLSSLFNHLWQSTLFAAVVGLLAIALRKNHAQARYRLWLIASVKFLIPFSLLVGMGSHLSWSTATSTAQPQMSVVMEQIVQPFPQAQAVVASAPLAHNSNLLATFVLLLWTCGFLVVVFSWARQWWRIRAAVHASFPLSFEANVPVLSSPAPLEPGVFGIFRPVLLLPEGIADRLASAELRAVFAHELCHVRRRDNLAAAVHMLVEAIFWFHPLVWWLGARVTEERERACDEEVLRLGGEPQVYAESILKICEFCIESPLACMSGVTGADLKKRIVHIMAQCAVRELEFGKKLLLALGGIAAVAGPLMFGLLNAPPSRAQSQPSAGAAPRFEVTSIKSNNSMDQAIGMFFSPGRVRVKNYTLRSLIEDTYSLKRYQVSGGPGWVNSERYDIEAKAEENVGAKQMIVMLRTLLADRFQVKFHRETRQGPVYKLIVAKSGPKLHEPTEREETRPNLKIEVDGFVGHEVSMRWFTDALSAQLDRPVMDGTDLTGGYDFRLHYTPDNSEPADPNAPSAASILTAVQEQLGLKLESAKGPVEILVIDHVEKPSEN
jgi:uncharacterized protein (TIGR03435 family)